MYSFNSCFQSRFVNTKKITSILKNPHFFLRSFPRSSTFFSTISTLRLLLLLQRSYINSDFEERETNKILFSACWTACRAACRTACRTASWSRCRGINTKPLRTMNIFKTEMNRICISHTLSLYHTFFIISSSFSVAACL